MNRRADPNRQPATGPLSILVLRARRVGLAWAEEVAARDPAPPARPWPYQPADAGPVLAAAGVAGTELELEGLVLVAHAAALERWRALVAAAARRRGGRP